MNNSGNKTISVRLIYIVLAIGIIGASVIFVRNKNVSEIEVASTVEEQTIDSSKTEIAAKTTDRTSSIISSRASQDLRKVIDGVKEQAKKQEQKESTTNSKKSEKTTTTTTKKDTEKTNKKTTTTKTETSKNTTVKSSAEKKDSSKTTTKRESNSNSKTSSKVESSKEKTKTTTTTTESKKTTTKTTSKKDVKISKTMDLTKRTGLSREDFIKLIAGVKADTSGFFEKNAGKIYDLCKKYSINEIFFCGLISAESGWNIASNHRRTHNYISLMSGGRLIKYSSVNEGLEVAAQKLHYNYLTPGGKFYHGKTLAGVKVCFCPSGNWVNLVYGRMKQIL